MERAIGPLVSNDRPSGTTPSRESRPRVGLMHASPFAAQGLRIDPPVSVPSAIGAYQAATAAPEPPLEPRLHGRWRAGFFFEFAPGRYERIFIVEFAFGNCPGAFVLVAPERTSRMN